MVDTSLNHIIVSNNNVEVVKSNDALTIKDFSVEVDGDSTLLIEYHDALYEKFIINIKKGDVKLTEVYNIKYNKNLDKVIIVNDNANLTRFHYINNDENINLIENIYINKNSKIKDAFIDLTNSNMINTVYYHLIKEGAAANVRVGVLGHNASEKKVIVEMNHIAPNTSSTMDNYGVAKDHTNLTIDGVGRITKGQYNSSSHQVNKIIVFDPTAKASANPYLFIDEHEVSASHGASVGKINEDHLYYLQSRGLSKNEAMNLVIQGYFAPVIEYISTNEQKDLFLEMLQEKVAM